MRITINQNDGVVGVDGVFRQVDLSEIAGEIHAIQFDTTSGRGVIEYDESVGEDVQQRDNQAEDAAWAAARAEGVPERKIRIPVMMKSVFVPRPARPITDFGPYQVYLDRWAAAAPPEPIVEDLRARVLDEKRAEALRALEDQRLAAALEDQDAPQAVKDYAAALDDK